MADVELTATTVEGVTGDRVTVEDWRAKQLIRGGAAVPATKPAARQIGAAPETAATAKKE